MKVKELKEFIKDLDDNAVITVCNDDQDYCYELVECRTCEDHSSPQYKKFLDLVIEEKESESAIYSTEMMYSFFVAMHDNGHNVMQAEEECVRNYNFSTNEFEDTVKDMTVDNLAYLYRQAENLAQDNMNGEYHNYNFTGSDYKSMIMSYVENNLLVDDKNDFDEMISSMAC